MVVKVPERLMKVKMPPA
jgi:hypothetical protein